MITFAEIVEQSAHIRDEDELRDVVQQLLAKGLLRQLNRWDNAGPHPVVYELTKDGIEAARRSQ